MSAKQKREYLARLKAISVADAAVPSFAEFVEKTTTLELDDWQRVLCSRLERLRHESGQRILIHAPPQHGKSILVSQRFPAWLIGCRPETRVKLACYNVTHAVGFGRIVLQLMQSDEYAALFPGAGLRVPKMASAESWSTAARRALMDAQPSFKALGLLTGFVGQGADTLLIDDPYASPQDAASEVIRGHVWSFWDESARVRLNEASNVVVMFHRYHEDDLAGRLWATGQWEMIRFAAIADGDPEWPDPIGRGEGEKLSPRFSDDFYAAQQQSPPVWLGQFQGRPTAVGGNLLKVGEIRQAPSTLPEMRIYQAWDLAISTKSTADYTCCGTVGIDRDSNLYLLDVLRGRWTFNETIDLMASQAAVWHPCGIAIETTSYQASAFEEATRRHLLPFREVKPDRDKVVRAQLLAARIAAGKVYANRMASWWPEFEAEALAFPAGKKDDQVDAVVYAVQEAASPPAAASSHTEPGEDWYDSDFSVSPW